MIVYIVATAIVSVAITLGIQKVMGVFDKPENSNSNRKGSSDTGDENTDPVFN